MQQGCHSHTQQTTLRTEAGEARADSLKAICYRWLRERRPEPPAPREGRAGNAGDVLLTLGLSARPWLKVALREEAPGNSPMEGSGCPPTPWCAEFYTLGVKHTVNARERERIWELKNKRAKISNKGKLIKKAK